jgi:hypothetical protein
MAVDIVIPLALALAVRTGDHRLETRARVAWEEWPPLPGNNINHHLEDFLQLRAIKADVRQGLLHLYHEFCRTKDCPACPMGRYN